MAKQFIISLFIFIFFLSVSGRPASLPASEGTSSSHRCRRTVVQSIELLSEFKIKSGFIFKNTTVGGLSAITYDHKRNVYYLLSDDGQGGKQRFYTAQIDLSSYNVTIIDVTYLKRSNGSPIGERDIDPEGLVYTNSDTLIVSSERLLPSIFEFELNGKLIRYFNVPDYYMPNLDGSFGTRGNLGFEGLSLSPDGKFLWAANEGALAQDGPESSVTEESPARFISFDVATGNPVDEFVYNIGRVTRTGMNGTGFAFNGLTEIISLTNKMPQNELIFITMERAFFMGATIPDRGNTIKLYEVSTKGAKNIVNMDTLTQRFSERNVVKKSLLADLEKDFGIIPDNLEGLQMMKTGCGEAVLIVMADDNFSSAGLQSTQFLFLKMKGDF